MKLYKHDNIECLKKEKIRKKKEAKHSQYCVMLSDYGVTKYRNLTHLLGYTLTDHNVDRV